MQQTIDSRAGVRAHPLQAADENASTGEFVWLPRALAWRIFIGVSVVAFTTLAFSAYLRPNMVFDLANMIFCG